MVTAGDDVRETIRRVLLDPFVAATGCRLQLGYTDYGHLANGGDAVDLALVEERWSVDLATAGVLAELEAIGSDGVVPDLVPSSSMSIPAYADAIVSAYRLDAIGVESLPITWSDWWQVRARPGNRTLAKGPFGTFEFSLLADGVVPAELYPLDLERAIAGLGRISGSIVDRWWESGPQSIDWLSGGRAAFGSALAHQVFAAQRTGRPVAAIWNQGLLFAARWIVPIGTANADVARDFIRFALSAASQAAMATVAGLAPVSSAGFVGVDPALRPLLATSPVNLPRLIRSDAAWWAANATRASQAFDSWLLGDPRGRG